MKINIFKLYSPDGKQLLYEFGAKDSAVKYGTKKYGTFKYGEKTNNGNLLALETFFDCDSICSELQSASFGATITSFTKLEIPEKAKAKIWNHDGSYIGTFELEKPQRTALRTYSLSGYDYLGVADNLENFGFHLSVFPLTRLAESFARVGVPVILSDSVKDDVITGSALPRAYTMREILQHLAVAYGYKISTFGVDGIKIFSDADIVQKTYLTQSIKEGVSFEDETVDIDKVEISTTELEAEQEESGHPLYDGIGSRPVIGYVPLSDGDFTFVRFSATGENPLDMNEENVKYIDEGYVWKTAKAKNSTPKLLKNYTVIEANLDFRFRFGIGANERYVSSYASCYTTINNEIIVTIDNAKFLEVVEEFKNSSESQLTEIAKPSLDNPLKALVVVNVPQAANDEKSVDFASSDIGDGENVSQFVTPFVTDSMTERIKKHYKNTKKINYSCKYTGEKLFDSVELPEIYDEKYSKSIIESCALRFSTYSVWADIEARVFEEGAKI